MPTATRTRRNASTRTKSGNRSSRKKKQQKQPAAVSRTRAPDGMDLAAWQRELRRQFGSQQSFKLANLGDEPFFSEFSVSNPKSGGKYRVAIRGEQAGENFCSCADFATNQLGTCKHVEFVLGKLRRKRGGKKALAAGFQPPYSEVFVRYGAQREVCFRPGSECPAAVARLASRWFDSEGTLDPEKFGEFEKFVKQAARHNHELRCYDDALDLIAQHRDAATRAGLVRQMFPKAIRSAAFKKLLKVPLYDYQREGALFAARAGRSLIADDMGLGKTIQALAAAEIMARLFGVERVLIVCPTSLKHQWEREIERFTDRASCVVGGMLSARQRLFDHDPAFFKITNYDTVHTDLEAIQRWSPDLVILDEAQRIKNWDTRTARSVKRLRSPYAIVLTGTPLENRLEELVSIVQFVDQHRLGPTYRFLHQHQVYDEASRRVVGYRDLDQIGQTLGSVLLRRHKDQVLKQLPQRLQKRLFVPMTPQQMAVHDEYREVVAKLVQKWRRWHFLSESDQRRMRIALQYMRMSCDSTYLVDKETDHGLKTEELMNVLEEILEQQQSKVVVFSQWTRMHELVIRRLQKRRWDHAFFHGGVATPGRKKLVNQFRDDERCRLFLSTDAGGVGLNLQHADTVINLDLPWNPAVLEQRIGRVHRLGQKRSVQVVDFVAQGTIEEGMLSLLNFKQSVFSGVLDGGEKDVFLGESRLKRFIETVEKVSGTIPAGETRSPADATRRSAGNGDSAAKRNGRRAAADQARGSENPEALAQLLSLGAEFVQQLAQSLAAPASKSTTGLITRDSSGQPVLQVPLPKREVMDQVAGVLHQLLTAR